MWKRICTIAAVVVITVFGFCGISLNASAEESNGALTASANSFINAVEKASGGEVVYHLYYDFDGNGTKEMFALVKKDPSDSIWDEEDGVMGGRLWYANEDGAIEVMSQPRPYYGDPQVMTFDDGQSVLPLDQVYATGTRTYLWGVLGGKPYELNASGRINGLDLNKYGEIEGIGEDYNASWSKDYGFAGHTWNKYYFYYDHGNIREYGGKDITWEEFCRIPGIEEVTDKIKTEKLQQGEEIKSIYYRSNGIVAVNFESETEYAVDYSNMQIRITEKGVEICTSMSDSGFAGGSIAGALLDALATYPEAFPY